MSRAPILLALIGLLALLIGGLWWGLGLGSGTLQAAAGTQEETELAQAAGSVLSSEDPGARRSELAPVQQPEENNAAPSEPKLRPSGRLVSGRVLDVMGAPVAQAEVYALAGEGQLALPLELEPEFWPGGRPRILRTQTDAQGRYAFHGPPLKELRVMARKPGMLRAYLPKRRLPQLKDELELDPLVLEPVASKQGEVRAMDGSAIAGASILRAIEALHPGEPVTLEGAAVPIATSAADGRFVLEEEAAGPWALWAQAEGFLPARLSGEELARDQVVFRLEPGLTLRGEVIVLNGASLPADAIVLAWPAQPEDAEEEESASLQSRADAVATLQRGVRAALDATGKFELKGLRAGQEHLLELVAPDESATPRRVPGSQTTRVAASERHARIEIDAPLESVGTVLDEQSGQPIEQFQAWAGQPGRERLLRTADGRPWVAHPAGRYSFLDLRANRNRAVRVRVRAPGYLEAESSEFMPKAKGRTEIPVIRLKPAPRLRVRVVRAGDQQPIADARVLLETRGAEALKNLLQQPEEEDRERLQGTNFARTAADGTAWISARSDAPFHVGASARDCVPAEPVACAALQPGEDREVLIQLSAGGRVRIEVRDPSGRPVAGIGILRRLPQTGVDTEDWTQLTPELETNARGEALFVALPRGTHLFRAHEGAGPAWVSNASDAATRDWNSVAVTEGAESLLQLRVGGRVVLSGTVREARRPLAGARVSLLPVTPEGAREGDVWQQARHVQTNARGEYRFEPTAAGAYRLSVLHERRAMPQVTLLNLSQPAQRHDVDLEAASIAGRIVDTQGQPVAGFSISIGSQDEFAWDFDDSSASLRIANGRPQVVDLDLTRNEMRTGPDGRFAFEGVRTGVGLSLSAWHEEYEHLQQELSALAPDESRTGLEFRLARACRITVKLQRPAPAGPNDPWNRVSVVQLFEGGREKQRAEEWLQDSTTAGSLGPGRYRLVLRTQEGAPVAGVAPQEVTLEESQVAEVVFTLP